MANNEFQQLQDALKKAPTEEAMKATAEALRRYLEASKVRRQSLGVKRPGSQPLLVNLGLGKNYPSAIALDDMPAQLENNPAFFNLMADVLSTKESSK